MHVGEEKSASSRAHVGPGNAADTPLDERLGRLSQPIERGARFERTGLIARGGMGEVHRARDVELDRELALKEMLAGSSDPRVAAARFLEEAQVTARLDHPGIVPVHEVGRDAEGRLYFAMKLVQGRDLKEVFELVAAGREGWSHARALGVLLKVCEAMAYAHSKGVIHRDLKPANVMVGRFGEVYVMDWGLARVLGREDLHDIRLRPADETEVLNTPRSDEREETPDSPLLTMDGVIVGTPAYMPPEQGRGEIQLLSPRSDVYSLGALLYHLLCAHVPFVPPGARVSKHAILARLLEGPPRALSAENPAAPIELVAICEKAMARDPALRYADMRELGDDLRAYLEGRVVHAHARGPIAELSKWVHRNRTFAAACGAALVFLVGGFVVSSGALVRAKESAALAKSEKDRADAAARVAALGQEQLLRLSDLQRLAALQHDADSLWPVRPESVDALEEWLGRSRQLLASLPEHKQTLLTLEASHRTEDLWWFDQFRALVGALESLRDPTRGLISGTSSEHGSGIERRLEYARTVRERTVTGAEAARRWREVIEDVRDPASWYHGLVLTPQLGLLPIGRDPHSGLWEFAHLQSGEPPERDDEGRLEVTLETGLVFVLIPGGRFLMGAQSRTADGENYDPSTSARSEPVLEVVLDPYFLSKYEMTRSQWSRIMGQDLSRPGAIDGGALPARGLSWIECQILSSRLDLCLPTEAQWEYAARGGTTTPWWTGEDAESLGSAGNLADVRLLRSTAVRSFDALLDDGAAETARVGSYDPNPFGLHDVIGNVREWCRDRFAAYLHGHRAGDGEILLSEREVAAGQYSRVLRGGSWIDLPVWATSAARMGWPAEQIDLPNGLRPARAVSP